MGKDKLSARNIDELPVTVQAEFHSSYPYPTQYSSNQISYGRPNEKYDAAKDRAFVDALLGLSPNATTKQKPKALYPLSYLNGENGNHRDARSSLPSSEKMSPATLPHSRPIAS